MNQEELIQYFTSNKNKGILWKLMGDNDLFNDIQTNDASKVKQLFESNILNLSLNITRNNEIIDLNKKIITNMVNELNILRENSSSTIIPQHYKVSDVTEKRQKEFDNKLQNKQVEFQELIKTPNPETPDFSDKVDQPMEGDIDKILKEQLAYRESQLNIVLETQDKVKAEKWLQEGNTNQKQEDNIVHLTIGEQVPLTENEIVDPLIINQAITNPKKQVKFSDEKNNETHITNNAFLASLKKKSDVNEINVNEINVNENEIREIKNTLREILDNQSKILALLMK